MIFPHEPSDLLPVHPDTHVRQPHMDSADALGIAPEAVCLQDLRKRRPVPFLPEFSGPLGTDPVVVPERETPANWHSSFTVSTLLRSARAARTARIVLRRCPWLLFWPVVQLHDFFKKAICCWSTGSPASCAWRLIRWCCKPCASCEAHASPGTLAKPLR